MFFYQTTVDTVTPDLLKYGFFHGNTDITVLDLHFIDFPKVNTVDGALAIIEEKRKTLTNPYNHSFLCIKLIFPNETTLNDITTLTHRTGHAFNFYYNDDVFVFSIIYTDKYNILHSILCISDIERSLTESSIYHFPYETIFDIFKSAFSEYDIPEFTQEALYVFSCKTTPPTYDGVIHLHCPLITK